MSLLWLVVRGRVLTAVSPPCAIVSGLTGCVWSVVKGTDEFEHAWFNNMGEDLEANKASTHLPPLPPLVLARVVHVCFAEGLPYRVGFLEISMSPGFNRKYQGPSSVWRGGGWEEGGSVSNTVNLVFGRPN